MCYADLPFLKLSSLCLLWWVFSSWEELRLSKLGERSSVCVWLEYDSKFNFLQLKYLNRWRSWKKDIILADVEREEKELELEMVHVDFIMAEEATEFKVVGTATISVKVWE